MIRHFLCDTDLTRQEQHSVLALAQAMKADRFGYRPLAGPQTVAVLFDKTSTRTRVSFAAGIADLGGSPLIIDSGESQLGHKESIADTARALSGMVSALVWRTYRQEDLQELAHYAGVPVINALSDSYHPCQVLADLLTIQEEFGDLTAKKLAFLGDGSSNMAQSLLLGAAIAGMQVALACPQEYQPDAQPVNQARQLAQQAGGSVTISQDPQEVVKDAHVLVTDTWVSMGQEQESRQRQQILSPYQVNKERMQAAHPQAIFLHCLPAYRGSEVSAEVIDGPQSRVWQEAENRLHAQKALLTFLLVESGLADSYDQAGR
ncbi:MAG: ornithine carbamoyltransferase [Rothia sp. (in: high G+C Gram-positive bacteria)]|nr:ornithine carbamoyltransferase [Rothia sp. (in: high G+C Gram-positive bacteria)]